MRLGKYKLIYSWPGADGLIELTPLSKKPVEYGQSKGIVRNGDQALGPHWKGYEQTHQNETCDPYCLYDVSVDLGETQNLASRADLQDTIAAMKRRLQQEAATGAPVCGRVPSKDWNQVYLPIVCANVAKTNGFWLPVDWDGQKPPPLPPSPPPGGCPAEAREQCPWEKYPDPKSCRQCCHDKKLNLPDCKPKDFNAYCNKTDEVEFV